MGAGQSMEVERALDEAPTAQAAAAVLGSLEPGALAEALRDQGVRDGPDLLSRLEALPATKDVAPVDNFLDRLRTIRAACVRVEAKGQQLRGTKQDLDDMDAKKNSNADDLLYATRVDLAAQLAAHSSLPSKSPETSRSMVRRLASPPATRCSIRVAAAGPLGMRTATVRFS